MAQIPEQKNLQDLRIDLDASRRVHGKEHPETVARMRELSSAYRERGDYESAIPLLWELLSVHQGTSGNWNSDIIITANALGLALYGSGDYERAREVFESTLQASRHLYGDGDDTSILILRNLVATLAALGRYTAFGDVGNEIIDARLAWDIGADDDRTVNNLALLATNWRLIFEYSRSKQLYYRVIRECVKGRTLPGVCLRAIFERVVFIPAQGIMLRCGGNDAKSQVRRQIQRMNEKAAQQARSRIRG
jgi:tetratricopeptide (TPR) repeat protein